MNNETRTILEKLIEGHKKAVKLYTAIEDSVDQITYNGLVKLAVNKRLYVFSDELKAMLEADTKPTMHDLKRELMNTVVKQHNITLLSIEAIENLLKEEYENE